MSQRTPWTAAALSILACLTWNVPSPGAEPQPSLDELLKEYKALGLPLPPKGAKLVRYVTNPGRRNGREEPKQYALVFEVKPGTRSTPSILLRGTDEFEPYRWQPYHAVEPDAALLINLAINWHLVLAIQCHARGYDQLARPLLDDSLRVAKVPWRKELLQIAWTYWEGRVTQAGTDRAEASKRLKELIERDKEFDTPRSQAVLKSLDLALVPSRVKPGSIDALIDGLVDYTRYPDGLDGFRAEDCYWRVANLGFDAVPALIDHLDDERLTRGIMQGFNNFGSWNLRVGDVAGQLLEGLAGDYINGDWVRRLQGYRVEKADAIRWWDESRRVREETYLTEHVLVRVKGDADKTVIDEHHLHVLAAKYPTRVVELYKTILEKHPKVDTYLFPEVLRGCRLPVHEKLAVLLQAAKNKDMGRRQEAAWLIRRLDEEEFDTLLLATLTALPRDVDGSDELIAEARIAQFALQSRDPRVWEAFQMAARRSTAELRIELLACYPENRSRRNEVMRRLAVFIDDASLRKSISIRDSKWSSAAEDYRKIEVRNFVALELAELVDIEVEVKPDRTPEEWARLRKQVQETVERELGKMK